jgi:hypothetical protein
MRLALAILVGIDACRTARAGGAASGRHQVFVVAAQEAVLLARVLEWRADLLEAGAAFALDRAAVVIFFALVGAVAVFDLVDALGWAGELRRVEARVAIQCHLTLAAGRFGAAHAAAHRRVGATRGTAAGIAGAASRAGAR